MNVLERVRQATGERHSILYAKYVTLSHVPLTKEEESELPEETDISTYVDPIAVSVIKGPLVEEYPETKDLETDTGVSHTKSACPDQE